MKKFNPQNKVKTSMKLAPVIAALTGAAVILTGCSNSQGSSTSSGIGDSSAIWTTAETSEDTTDASTADASASVETTADDTSSTSASSDEKENGNGIDQTADDSGQNPMMNYIGNYINGSATMNVSCIGKDEASVTITKENSSDSFSWSMSGPVSVGDDRIIVSYDNCIKKYLEYNESGQLNCVITMYENGSGTVEFLFSDNNAYWHDGAEGLFADSVFTFSN